MGEKSKDKLDQNIEQYKIIFEVSPEAIVILDASGNVLNVNSRLCDWLGYRPEEAIGKPLLALPFLPEQSKAKAIGKLRQRIAGEELPPYDLDFIARDGEIRTGRIVANPVKNAAGEVIQDIVMISDITEFKCTENERNESEERFRNIFAESPIGIEIYDNDGHLFDANRSCLDMFGVSDIEEVRGFHLFSDPNVPDYAKDKLHQDLAVRYELPFDFQKVEELGLYATTKSGLAHMDVLITPLPTGGHMVQAQDITERVKTEKELERHRKHLETMVEERTTELAQVNSQLREEINERKQIENKILDSTQRWQTTFDAIGDPICLMDKQLKIIQCNKAMMDFIEKPADKIIGHACYELIHGTSDPPEGCPTIVMMETLQRESYKWQIGGRWFEVTTDPILDESGKLANIVHIMSDITEHMRLEEELLKSQKLESIGVLAGGIAHNFNNFLTGILGNVSLAQLHLDAGKPNSKITERLSQCEKAVMKAKALTQRLITFAAGGAPITKRTSVADLLMDSVKSALADSNVKCDFAIRDDLWLVEMDEAQMDQVIRNIIINSDEAMPTGGMIRINAQNIFVKLHDSLPLVDGEYVRISIADQGIGIPEKSINHIFDPFFTTKPRSSGLGLAVSYSIVRKHHGLITAKSQIGIGTTIDIYLPNAPMTNRAKSDKKEVRHDKLIGKILVMDDENLLRELLAEILDNLGYEVMAVSDGSEAIDIYKQAIDTGNPFDIVILDLTVPGGMGGQETLRRLIAIDSEVSAIVSSGYHNDPVMTNFRNYGFAGGIAKPYIVSELDVVLREVLENK